MPSSSQQRLQQVLSHYLDTQQCPDVAEVRRLLSEVTPDVALQTLKVCESKLSTWTALARAATCNHTELIVTILSSLPQQHRLDLLMAYTFTPLHRAAYYGSTESVEALLSQLTAAQQLQLLSVRDSGGRTAAVLATQLVHTETVKVLGEYKQRAEQQIEQQHEAGEFVQVCLSV